MFINSTLIFFCGALYNTNSLISSSTSKSIFLHAVPSIFNAKLEEMSFNSALILALFKKETCSESVITITPSFNSLRKSFFKAVQLCKFATNLFYGAKARLL